MVEYEEIVNFIQRSCLLMDKEDFSGFLELCNSNFKYKITAYSPEINQEMIWMDEDYEGIKILFLMIPSHLRRLGSLMRHVSIGQIDRKTNIILVNSSFFITHTNLDGKSDIFAVGRYKDLIKQEDDNIFLESREAYLETRDLGIGSHVPI